MGQLKFWPCSRTFPLLAELVKKEEREKDSWDDQLLALSRIEDDPVIFGFLTFWVGNNLKRWLESLDGYPSEQIPYACATESFVLEFVVFLGEHFSEEIDELLVQISGRFTD